MKINCANDSNKNCFLFFNENKSPNLGKHCKTKTRNEIKENLLKFNFNDCLQGSPFNNGLRTKQKQFNYLNLMPNNINLPINDDDQNNFGSFLNKINNSSGKNGPNINIIFFAPNCGINNVETENKNEKYNPVNNSMNSNNSLNEPNKVKKNEKNDMFNFNIGHEEKKCENEKINSPIKNNKSLFDSNFNLIEENCGKDDISEILKEFANLNLKSSVKQNSSNDNPKIYTNTGDSVNIYTIEGSGKKERKYYNMPNPYAKNVYKK